MARPARRRRPSADEVTYDIRELGANRARFDEACAAARAAKLDAVLSWRASGGNISTPSWKLVDPQDRWAEVSSTARTYDLLSRLAYPPSIYGDIEWMRSVPAGTSAGRVSDVLRWLEEDPFCLHSGYVKQRVLRLLRRFTFTEDQSEALGRIILAVIQRGPRLEFREVRRIAPRADSGEFRRALNDLAAAADEGTAWRAKQLLGACERKARGPRTPGT